MSQYRNELKDYMLAEISNKNQADKRYHQGRLPGAVPNYIQQAARLEQFDRNQIRDKIKLTKQPYEPTDNDVIYDNNATISGIYDQYFLLDSAYRKPPYDTIEDGLMTFIIDDVNQNPNKETGSVGSNLEQDRIFELSFSPFYVPGTLPNNTNPLTGAPEGFNSPFFHREITVEIKEFSSQEVRSPDNRNFHYLFRGTQTGSEIDQGIINFVNIYPRIRSTFYKPHYTIQTITICLKSITGGNLGLLSDVYLNPTITLPGTNPMEIIWPNHGFPITAANQVVILKNFQSTDPTVDEAANNESGYVLTVIDANRISIPVDATSLTTQPTIERIIAQNRRIYLKTRFRGIAGFATNYIIHT